MASSSEWLVLLFIFILHLSCVPSKCVHLIAFFLVYMPLIDLMQIHVNQGRK